MIYKLTKNKIINFLTYFGILFLIYCILVIFLFSYFFSSTNEIQKNERINLFVECYNTNDNIEKNLLTKLHENNFNKILSVNVYSYSPIDKNIASYYEAFGKDADALILTKKDLLDIDEVICESFLEIDTQISNEILLNNSFTYYEFNEIKYAIEVYGKKSNYLSKYFTFHKEEVPDNEFYLLINKTSQNLENKILSTCLNYLFEEKI